MSKSFVKWLGICMALSMVLLTACTGNNSDAGTAGDGKALAKEQVLNVGSIPSEPPGLDPLKARDSASGLILSQLMEGLTKTDTEGKALPGIATKWEANKDSSQFTFHLRDAKWSNGDPVTAVDFEYAWKRMLDPKNAAIYAYQLFYLKNGEKYNQGKAKVDDVGVKAVDDKTLKVTLERPTPYFPSLAAFYALFPVNKKVAEADKKWAGDAKTFVSNGAFKMKEWKHNAKIVLEKNEKYYNKKKTKLTQINFPFVTDTKTGYQQFQSGELDEGDSNLIPTDLTKSLIEKKEAKGGPNPASYGIDFNTKKKPFTNANIRRAFALAIDRQSIVENVTQAGQEPANGWVPWGMPDFSTKDDWVKNHDKYLDAKANASEAKKLLEKGLKEEKIDKLPKVTFSYNTDDGHKKIAEALQQMWKDNLGVDVKLANMEWKVFLEKKSSGDYDMARTGWLPDYIDPMTFMDLYMTGSGQNDAKFNNKEFDKLIKEAKSTDNQDKRMKSMHKAEDILMKEMPVAPLYWYTRLHMQKDYVKNVKRSIDGTVYYTEAYLTEH
ncbi:oligopeptide transport system substrate-binding protein [Marininema mesophilum]|uniref:Oligopeptide transport system substrate-binding protein n=1 Tax=Marininema mesophilum TaxID=1048340 RepID=A0A1H2RVH0_9BACL|nr:peptide ABC transporter substrate-binding protein [Marininema mesophilum]SDW22619.1 oligopeptide transport system substrate-binding protein [Marininema mesophilum]